MPPPGRKCVPDPDFLAGDLAKAARLVVGKGLVDLFAGVHHERAVAGDRLAQRLAGQHQRAGARSGGAQRQRVASGQQGHVAIGHRARLFTCGQRTAEHVDECALRRRDVEVDLRAVTLSFKRIGQAPGDATAEQLERAAELADRFSAGEARVTHDQNLLLPWVRCDALPELWREARRLGLARPNIGLLTDMISCPGGDFCDLANARSLPLAQALLERYRDLDELHDLGEIDLHISGCINSCGHHHSGHIGILGVDKDGQEWYQITLGGSDGTRLSGTAQPGKVIGPSFAASEVVDVIEALLDTYRQQRTEGETFLATLRRTGPDAFKAAAHAVRTATARADTATA